MHKYMQKRPVLTIIYLQGIQYPDQILTQIFAPDRALRQFSLFSPLSYFCFPLSNRSIHSAQQEKKANLEE